MHARWRDYLRPGISEKPWTNEEMVKLTHLHKKHGNAWAKLSSLLPGR